MKGPRSKKVECTKKEVQAILDLQDKEEWLVWLRSDMVQPWWQRRTVCWIVCALMAHLLLLHHHHKLFQWRHGPTRPSRPSAITSGSGKLPYSHPPASKPPSAASSSPWYAGEILASSFSGQEPIASGLAASGFGSKLIRAPSRIPRRRAVWQSPSSKGYLLPNPKDWKLYLTHCNQGCNCVGTANNTGPTDPPPSTTAATNPATMHATKARAGPKEATSPAPDKRVSTASAASKSSSSSGGGGFRRTIRTTARLQSPPGLRHRPGHSPAGRDSAPNDGWDGQKGAILPV
ncbi:hypothetical protein Aspvir_009107 [Aspergillus viridinutans]|uniref:Uncharacterized protein n=1 Tax=Aspergillus viridinutans TaxID=75553 RepID=A0A9P3F857_ASPVI|nr:uncharacterized protein Aspvir_009107 [Aspergillus viridinutans]GIK05008.1 hypothetical protein Aspvir_009107 [Aspergillus viridinutans]